MALPLGVEPHDHALAHSGTFQGRRYVNEGVLLVGAGPSHSPYNKSFDPLSLPRIRSSSFHHGKGQFLASYWLNFLAHHDDLRFRSAGNPSRVTFPRSFAPSLAPRFRRLARPY
jgi:hypothetical protein